MLSQPFSVHNLTAWFMLAPCDPRPAGVAAVDTFPDYHVLEESIEASLALLHETGSVSELLIENSGDVDLFIQAGDIVKGGRQDRTIGVDFIVPAQSGRIPLPAFCVEQSRWHRRGVESVDRFSSSKYAVSAENGSHGDALRQEPRVERVAAPVLRLTRGGSFPIIPLHFAACRSPFATSGRSTRW